MFLNNHTGYFVFISLENLLKTSRRESRLLVKTGQSVIWTWWPHAESIPVSPPSPLWTGLCAGPRRGRYSTTLKIILILMFINFGLFLDPRTGTPLTHLLRHKSFQGSSSCPGSGMGGPCCRSGQSLELGWVPSSPLEWIYDSWTRCPWPQWR